MKQRIRVCDTDRPGEGEYIRLEATWRQEPTSIVVFRYRGEVFAYRNLCVHMPRRLDCEKDTIFDAGGKYLRCSMHGINYDPLTGESVSSLCPGEKLTPVRVAVDEDGVWIIDKRVRPTGNIP